jgi:sporulation protein YtfJ
MNEHQVNEHVSSEHPISELLRISMGNIKDMIDVNIIVGEPIEMRNASIIPVSKIRCGFVSGGTDQKLGRAAEEFDQYPFGGGAGGTWSITPIAFLVAANDEVKVLHLEESSHILEKMIDFVPNLIDQVKKSVSSSKEKNKPTVMTVEK